MKKVCGGRRYNLYVDATLVLARYVHFWILKWVAYEAATVLKGTKHWHSHYNFIKRVNTVFLCMFIVILVMKAVTLRCGVRIGKAVRIKYTQNTQNFRQEAASVPDDTISPIAWNELAALTSGRICHEMPFLRPVRKKDLGEKVDRQYRIQEGFTQLFLC